MKVVAVNGSARKDGNTAIIIRRIFGVLENHGIETELIQLAGHNIGGCRACYACRKNKDGKCVITGDIVNGIVAKMAAADGMILGSPVYFADISANLKALIERAGYIARANNYLFKHKAAAAVTAVRRGGAIHAFDTMNHFFLVNQMFLAGSTYWNMVIGREIGEVENDAEGLDNAQNLGENMALLLKKLNRS